MEDRLCCQSLHVKFRFFHCKLANPKSLEIKNKNEFFYFTMFTPVICESDTRLHINEMCSSFSEKGFQVKNHLLNNGNDVCIRLWSPSKTDVTVEYIA